MVLSLGLRWVLDGVEIDPRLLRLLSAIGERGSLKQAAVEAGFSYRHAWELLGRLETALGQRVVELERGRGTRLTPFGVRLSENVAATEKRLSGELKRSVAALNRPLLRASKAPAATISICASHDLALTRLADTIAQREGPAIELHFQGSVDALMSLARNQCDVAGFHVPDVPGHAALIEPYRPWLKTPTLRLVHFADRRQGLIVARGNPLGIAQLGDLVRRRARFVNRQPGSGTRLFFDALLAAHRIRPAQINGYRTEEFTHAAVAAMVASGMADATFGIEAAAAQHKLGFIGLASERYFLAARASALARPELRALLEALSSRWFRAAVSKLPGYVLPARVEAVSISAALERQAIEKYTMHTAKPRTKPERHPR